MNKIDLLYKSLRIRMIEEAIAARYKDQGMRCPVHLSIGQEANAVAIAEFLEPHDHMVSTHRGHAHYLAKGGSLIGLIGELYGKDIGCSGGNGGSMHLTDRACGFLGSTSIVGGTIPIGVGSAFSAALQGFNNRISAVCIGDAAIEEGVFHECANFASLHKLPVIFFVENNNYSCYTPLDQRQPKRSEAEKSKFANVARCYGMNFMHLQRETFIGQIPDVKRKINNLRKRKRGLPLLLECDAYRFIEHCGPNIDDDLGYRPSPEIEYNKMFDPITILSDIIETDELNKMKALIKIEIDEAFQVVEAAPPPEEKKLGAYLYA